MVKLFRYRNIRIRNILYEKIRCAVNDVVEPYSDQVFHRFLSLLRYTRQHSSQMIAEQGIRPREFSVLCFLRESGPATVGHVQHFLHKSASTTSALVAQLEEANYVTRTRSLEDNRVVIVELTPLGRDKAENTPLGGLPLLRRRLGKLPEERLVQIGTVLEEIQHLMEVTGSE
ncbi:MAG: MarR family winged helix-turn-helix transcriptional regulator [Anaerolineales bacterium]|nr:MarR family winged helix-turn-helix transcriptional regulator [Anaerolineales bacterium]